MKDLSSKEPPKLPTWTWEPFPKNANDYINLTAYALSADACFWTEKGYWFYKGEKGADGWHFLIKDLIEKGTAPKIKFHRVKSLNY